jgi:hypothetical protein
VHFCRLVNFGDDALAEDGGDVVGGIGLTIFRIDSPRNVSIFLFVELALEYLLL